MKLRVKDMDISTGGILVAILNTKDAKLLDLHMGDRLLVKAGRKSVTCILDISQSQRAVPPGQIGLFEEVLERLGLKNKDQVQVSITRKPESLAHIKKKMKGGELSYKELLHIMEDISQDRLTDIEKTFFVSAAYMRGLSTNEIVRMTKAMVDAGTKIKFSGLTLDKHCVGGVPGNRTTMIVIPIIAAAGYTIPKTSSRAITSPAGTADTMECLAKVTLKGTKIRQVVSKTGACIVHGGSMNLAPADDKIIDVEHPLSIDAEGQLLASVMAKKHSVSASYVLIDIPVGPGTKSATEKDAKRLARMFVLIGKRLGMKVRAVITDGSEPIGRGIGPLLEARDVMAVLSNDPNAPADLREKALVLAGMLLEMTGRVKRGRKKAEELLSSGAALAKMKEIIRAQGRVKEPELGSQTYKVRAKKSGRVKSIDNITIAKIAHAAGAPDDKGAGLLLEKHVGDSVKKGDLLYTIYAYSKGKLDLAKEVLDGFSGYKI